MSGTVLNDSSPEPLKRAASQVCTRQLKEAIAAGEPKQLKGALVAAQRLNGAKLPEFAEAVAKYKEVRKLPAGWDVSHMVLNRKGDKMVAKMEVSDPAVMGKFQRLLDLTHRKVYTRDRLGQTVPDRLQLVRVTTVTNDELWADYMMRRETIRRELADNPADFREYTVETAVPETDTDGELLKIVESLAADFAEPLLPTTNEVFLFHGTSEDAADKISTHDFKIKLAGTHAGTLYGRGIYLAENGSKSDEYTRPSNKDQDRHLLLLRACLGRVYYTDAKETDPRACEDACIRGKYHSVLGDRKKARGTFREFIVFNEEQVYPNYILTYRRVADSKAAVRAIMIECPKGAVPGTTLEAQTPEGISIQVLVPPGVEPGQKFQAQY
jgi:hypothetical protein